MLTNARPKDIVNNIFVFDKIMNYRTSCPILYSKSRDINKRHLDFMRILQYMGLYTIFVLLLGAWNIRLCNGSIEQSY